MRLVYSSDLHGNISWYQQLLELAIETGAQTAIVGGDLLPHALRRDTALAVQRAFVEQELAPLLRQFKHRYPELTLYTIPGNDDWAAAYRTLTALSTEGLLVDIHHCAVQTRSGLWLSGSGLINLTPFAIKDYERRDTVDAPTVRFATAFRSHDDTIIDYATEELLAQPTLSDALMSLAQHSDPQRTVFVLHCPPWQSLLDRRTGGRPVGSRAIRRFLEQHQPLLSLHGHLHESPEMSGAWLERIGTTIAINPGQAQRGFHAVVLDTDDVLSTAWHTVYGQYKQ